MLLYCLNADNEPHFITGVIYNEDAIWSESGLPEYQFNQSALPAALVNDGSLALPLQPNYLYQGPNSGKRVDLVEAYGNPANYKGSQEAWIIDTSKTDTASAATTPFTFGMISLISSFMMIVCMVV